MKGLYIHIPFCLKKCKYCNFNSFSPLCNEVKDYLSALFCEMREYKEEEVDTLFIGGGTPTCLEANDLKLLLEEIKNNFKISKNAEFTVEANPKTLDKEKLLILEKGGVNRISLGVQSFDDNELQKIGRVHTACDAIKTIELIKESGFSNFNIDLISAIPNQTEESFLNTLKTTISLNPSHISCYSLILEEETPLYEESLRGNLNIPDEETDRKMYELACELLKENGYTQYEISNFAKVGCKSRHNIKYWSCDEYIGIGLSASSYIGDVRFSNTDDFSEYIKGNFHDGERVILSKNDKMSEFVFMGLRKTEGISKVEFKKRFKEDIFDVFGEVILKYKKMGMIEETNDFLRLSHDALSISNTIMADFIL